MKNIACLLIESCLKAAEILIFTLAFMFIVFHEVQSYQKHFCTNLIYLFLSGDTAYNRDLLQTAQERVLR